MLMHMFLDRASSFETALPLPITSLGIVLPLLVTHVNILLKMSTPFAYIHLDK